MNTVDYAKERVQEIASEWKTPDDDIEPVLLAKSHGSDPDVPSDVLVVLSGIMSSEHAKEHGSKVAIPSLLAASNAVEATMVVSAYMVVREPDSEDETPPSQDPNRQEAVFVFGMNSDGEEETWLAYIGRDPLGNELPTLSEFEELSVGETDVAPAFEGRFVEAIRRGIKTATKIREAIDEVDEDEDA